MITCSSCGADNVDGAKFCVRCGAAIAGTAAATPGSWRDASGSSADLNPLPTEEAPGSSAYPPPYAPPVSNYPSSPPAPYGSYEQQQLSQSSNPFQPASGEAMHPAIPAVASLLLPGIGLLFVPNKAGLGIGVFAGYLVINIVLLIITVVTLGIGSCLFILVPLLNALAAVHSWDEAAKASHGKFQPILFKS